MTAEFDVVKSRPTGKRKPALRVLFPLDHRRVCFSGRGAEVTPAVFCRSFKQRGRRVHGEGIARHFKHRQIVDVAHDGAEALDYLYRRGAFESRPNDLPVVVLLDLKMPKVDGLEVLRQMKSDARLKSIPVVMLTSSREERDLVESYELGSNAYVVKPVDFQQFASSIRQLGCFWAVINEPPIVKQEQPA